MPEIICKTCRFFSPLINDCLHIACYSKEFSPISGSYYKKIKSLRPIRSLSNDALSPLELQLTRFKEFEDRRKDIKNGCPDWQYGTWFERWKNQFYSNPMK